jgi:hypothetical protein
VQISDLDQAIRLASKLRQQRAALDIISQQEAKDVSVSVPMGAQVSIPLILPMEWIFSFVAGQHQETASQLEALGVDVLAHDCFDMSKVGR